MGLLETKDCVITVAEEPVSSAASVDLASSSAEAEKAVEQPKSPTFLEKASAWITEWTPFGLVASYFVFSTCLYMVCSDGLIAVFW